MRPPVQLRLFAPEDLPHLQAIRAAAFAPVFQSFHDIVGGDIAALAFDRLEQDQAAHLAGICRDGSGHHVRIALIGAGPVGFVSFTADRERAVGEIGLNAVLPDHAGQGLGTAMFEAVLDEMRALGIRLATVSAGGDPSHAAARRAYAKVGFGRPLPSMEMYKLL